MRKSLLTQSGWQRRSADTTPINQSLFGAATLYLATSLGIPVSTTHTITGAIVGVGAARRVSAVRWGIAGSIMIAWVVTLPAAGLLGAVFYKCAALL